MTLQPLSDALRQFIVDHIRSVEQVEVLLLLFRTAPREWTAARVAQELRIDPASAAARLARAHEQGFAETRATSQVVEYWYDGAPPDQDRMLGELDRAFQQRRTTIIGLIFATPLSQPR
jgi:hypothetical protein